MSSFYSGTVTTTDTTAIENSTDAAAASQTAAKASETAAAASASSASTSASTATTKATEAATSATTATTKASEASTSASTATSKASEASTSASTATTKASEASTSATTASTKASEAATSATNAATSETNAAASATSASSSFDSFDDRYLGEKTSDPTVDNDGDALLTGAIYFNSANSKSRVYNGAAWQDIAPTTITTIDTSNLGNISDVSLSSVTTNDTLVYNGTNWVNSSDPTFGNLTVSELRGGSTLTLDPAGIGDNTGTVVIAGDLQVDGTTTTINSTTLTVDDKLVTVASGAANASAANGAGLEVDGASASLKYTYNSGDDYWLFNKDARVKSSSTDDAVFTIQTADDSASSILAMGDSSSSTIGKIEYDHSANDMIFVTGGTTSATLDSSGLDVTGDITLSGTVDGVDIAARDAILSSTKTTADAALPKAGGTISGDLTVSGSLTNINTLQGVGDVNSYSSVAQNDFLVRGASGWDNKAPADARSAMGLGSAAQSSSADFATAAQGTKADSALQTSDILNVLTSTSTVDALSAAQGKALKDDLDNAPQLSDATNRGHVEGINQALDTTADPEFYGLDVDNIRIDGRAITSTDTNGDIEITPNGDGDIKLDGQLWPRTAGADGKFLKVSSQSTGQLEWADAGGAPTIIKQTKVAVSTFGSTYHTHEWTHGQGSIPDLYFIELECTSANYGFAVGDVRRFYGHNNETTAGDNAQLSANSTKCTLRVTDDAALENVIRLDATSTASMTVHWKVGFVGIWF